MSEKDNSIVLLSKIITKQQLILNSMSKMIGDLAKITLSSLKSCNHSECDLPATLSYDEKFLCDKHTTIDIVSSSSKEEDWKEVDNVEQIRFISDYIKISNDIEKSVIIH